MKRRFRHLSSPYPCGYLPGRTARQETEWVEEISPSEYEQKLDEGWRRFGHCLYRPICPACTACRSLRVEVRRFQPSRNMKRVAARNRHDVRLAITEAAGEPEAEAIRLFRRYHEHQSRHKGWPEHGSESSTLKSTFLRNPLPTQRWDYRIEGRLVGLGFVDALPEALSAIYFVHDPDERDRSLGTWNILCLIERARELGARFVHLGYFVADCPSLSYKARFRPHQTLGPDGAWREAEA